MPIYTHNASTVRSQVSFSSIFNGVVNRAREQNQRRNQIKEKSREEA
jgi:hypothetical protein